jgi:fluoride exporter
VARPEDPSRGRLPVDPDLPASPSAAPPGMSALPALLVAVGGAAGGLARYGLGTALPPVDDGWPWGVFTANALGAFLIAALLVPVLGAGRSPAWVRPAVGTGFCGSFTTMSAVAVTTEQWARGGDLTAAAGWLSASMLSGLLAAGAGILLGRAVLLGRRRSR